VRFAASNERRKERGRGGREGERVGFLLTDLAPSVVEWLQNVLELRSGPHCQGMIVGGVVVVIVPAINADVIEIAEVDLHAVFHTGEADIVAMATSGGHEGHVVRCGESDLGLGRGGPLVLVRIYVLMAGVGDWEEEG
jgi:hypothetical protein